MGERFPMFLKVNIKGHGYTYIWSEESAANIDEKILDRELPIIDSTSNCPGIAYIVTRVAPTSFLLIVGAYWKNQTDEFKRAGLSYWHGVLFDTHHINRETLWELSNTLLGILQRFDSGYQEIGEIIGDLAKKKQEPNWIPSAFQLMRDIKPSMDHLEKKLVTTFIENNKQLESKINIHTDFPLHPMLAVPCMLSMLLADSSLRRIGGGSLQISKTTDVQIISVKGEVKNFKNISINNLLKPLLDEMSNQYPQLSKEKNGERLSLSQIGWSGIVILFMIIICAAIYFVFGQFIK